MLFKGKIIIIMLMVILRYEKFWYDEFKFGGNMIINVNDGIFLNWYKNVFFVLLIMLI